jgi:two-component system LytT family response regulator
MNSRLRALVVDDERLARKRLRDLLARHPEVEVVGEADGLESAREVAEALRPDLLFLDVELSPGSGFELLPLLSFRPTTIFVTAYETFAVRAFEVAAFDYLLKPVEPERLARAIGRLLLDREGSEQARAMERPRAEDPVVLKDAGTVRIVELAKIAAIRAEGAYSRVLLSEAPAMTVLRGISEWERLLPAEDFARIDRSLIVRPALVRRIEAVSRDEAWVTLEGLASRLEVGRAASLRLRRLVPGLA